MIHLREIVSTSSPTLVQRLVRSLLVILSIPYRFVIAVRNWMYDYGWKESKRFEVPVVSIGNLSVGGTGKSPAVAWLARYLRSRDVRIAILSRGYGQLDDGRNDEALELELALPDVPHLQNPNRLESARLAIDELDMQLLLLDDGFQHRRMARDLDIVLIDSTDASAARRLLPAGLYREPLRSLRRAHLAVLTRSDQVHADQVDQLEAAIRRVNPRLSVLRASHAASHLHRGEQPPGTLDELRGKEILAFCAIGNPEAFYRSLRSLGANVSATRSFPDHHGYTAEDITGLAAWGAQYPNAAMLVCTMKDWVKIVEPALGNKPLAALAIAMRFVDSSPLEQQLDRLVQGTTEGF